MPPISPILSRRDLPFSDNVPQLVYLFKYDRRDPDPRDMVFVGDPILNCRLVLTALDTPGGARFHIEALSRDALGKEHWSQLDYGFGAQETLLAHIMHRLLTTQTLNDQPTVRMGLDERGLRYWTTNPEPEITAEDEAAFDAHVRASNEAVDPGWYERNRQMIAVQDGINPPTPAELATRVEFRRERIRQWIAKGRPPFVEIR